MGWFKELLMTLYLMDRPIANRKKVDRRNDDRRWRGSEGDMPRAARDPRRKKERRNKKRR